MVKNEAALRGLRRLAVIQMAIIVLISLLFLYGSGRQAAWSALLGGLVCIVPTLWFGVRLFKHFGARAAKQIAMALYTGEALKLLLTVILFVVVFKWLHISAMAFFVSYIIMQCTVWLAAVII